MLLGALSKMDTMESARGFYGINPQKSPIMGLIVNSYYFLVGAGAIPARLFFRKNMGERAFSPFAFLLCLGFFAYYVIYPNEDFMLFGSILGNIGAIDIAKGQLGFVELITANLILNACILFLGWMIWKGIIHFKYIIKKAKLNTGGYSYYRGEGKYFEHRLGGTKWGFKIDERFIRMIIEPLTTIRAGLLLFIGSIAIGFAFYYVMKDTPNMVVAISLIILGWLNNLSLLILFSGICLFLEEFGIMMRIRGAALDMIDGEYDMQFVLKKKEELQSGSSNNDSTLALAEEIFQGKKPETETVQFQVASMPDDVHQGTLYTQEAYEINPQDTRTLHEKLREQFLKNQ